jgi:hypothetical protein
MLFVMIKPVRVFLQIFLCSASALAFEIALLRVFSISLWYHFAFMIVSIAMLGIGASGTLLSLRPRLKDPARIAAYALLLGISMSLGYLLANRISFDPVQLSWSKMQILYIGLYYIVLSAPFFFMGLVVSTALSSISEKSGLFYGADLLGAGAGSMLILAAMTVSDPGVAALGISVIPLSTAFVTGGRNIKTISFIFILLMSVLLSFNPTLAYPGMSQYKDLKAALRYPGAEHIKTYFSPYARIDTLRSPAVRYAPGLSLGYLDELPEQIGFSVDGGFLNAITHDDEKASMRFLMHLPSSLAYEIKKPGDVLILDPKGGLQVLVAYFYGASNVFTIESNPLLLDIIRRDYSEFSGGIYSRNARSGLGRSWLKHADKDFDIIDIPMTGASPSGFFGISEDYRFTLEAFGEYVNNLSPDGFLSVHMFIIPPPRTELRILFTIMTAMEKNGISHIEKNIAAIRSWGSINIIAKKSPLTESETDAIRKFSAAHRFDLVYYPGIAEEETNIYTRMPSNEYFHAFRDIINPADRCDFAADYLFDIRPVSDENPFPHYYLKLENIGQIYKKVDGKWQYFIEQGYILPAAFIQVLFISLILIMLPAFAMRSKKGRRNPGPDTKTGIGFLPYFACLGTGFMCVEIALIQKMILPLENPSYAFAAVLTSMLISSGIGSLLSYVFAGMRSPVTALVITILVLAYSIFLPAVSDSIAPLSLAQKFLFTFVIFMPLGLFMGVPFPAGLRLLGEKHGYLIPWAWAINGCLSVLAPVLAVMLAMSWGFKTVLWTGAGAYLLAFITHQRFLRKTARDY